MSLTRREQVRARQARQFALAGRDAANYRKRPSNSKRTMPIDHKALLFAAHHDAVLCTIVGIDGSFSRRLGAQLAVGRDGTLAGDMADKCLDAELARQAGIAAAEGTSRVLRYGQASPFIDFRLPCGSGLDILVDPAPDRAALQACVAELDARREASLSLPSEPGQLAQRRYLPALRLLVLGAGAECEALATLAGAQGIEAERREAGQGLSLNLVPRDLEADRWTAVLLLFHDHEWEHALLDWALGTEAFYIGAQGGAPAREDRIERLRAAGHGADTRARLHSPVGLIPRARDSAVLALSALADVVGAYEALHPHR
jgi:xanthine dehydrogenase accessory factor